MTIHAVPGEEVGNFLTRALFESRSKIIAINATHNEITIKVYPASCIQDLCDKYDLTMANTRVRMVRRNLLTY